MIKIVAISLFFSPVLLGSVNAMEIFHGTGKMTYEDGSVYQGEWRDGKKRGKGTMTYADGDVYEGKWDEDVFHGTGKMTYADGSVYDGK